MKVNVIVLNYNNYMDTVECIQSLIDCEINIRIIVVDNNSNNKSVEFINDYFLSLQSSNLKKRYCKVQSSDLSCVDDMLPDFVLLESESNNGYAAGNNLALKLLLSDTRYKDDYVWILNNDTLVVKESLLSLIRSYDLMRQSYKVGVIGNIILNEDNTLQSSGYRRHFFWKKHALNPVKERCKSMIYEVDDLSGCSMFFSLSLIKSVGLMNEDYFLYYEETDWLYKCQVMGYKHFVDTTSKIIHKEAKSTGGKLSPFVIYYMTRNKMKFVIDNYKRVSYIYLPLYVLKSLFKTIHYLFVDYSISKSILKGIVDGLKRKIGK